MYCTKCGVELESNVRYCPQCGVPTPAALEMLGHPQPSRPLTRWMPGRKIAGVCAGVARYSGLDVTLVRLIWFLLIFAPVPAIIAYIICWIVLPAEYLLPASPVMQTVQV